MSITTKLSLIQTELKAPKGQYNSFGKYKYRSCEDILEGVKPLLNKHNAAIAIGDEVVLIGERYYVKATVTLIDCETGETFFNTALAREEESKKGMDGSQVTGASSSYARKYALNGLLAIDDTKDSDATNTHGKDKEVREESLPSDPADAEKKAPLERKYLDSLILELERTGVKAGQINKKYKVLALDTLTFEQYIDAMTGLQNLPDKKKTDLGL